jgi:hypothetical protein
MLPVVGLRLVEGRVGSTLLMQVLASAPEVVLDRRYPYGEYRFLSYCSRAASVMAGPWRPDVDPGVTEFFVGDGARFGPLPFDPESLDRDELRKRALGHLWSAVSEAMLLREPRAGWYAEKLAVPIDAIVDAGIPLRVIDCVRDPRDVLVSIRKFTAAAGFDGFGRRPGEAESQYLPRFVATFAERLDEIAATPPEVDRVILRYEDFAVDLAGTANQLGEWLGLSLDPEAAPRSRLDQPQHLTTGSVEESIGRWRLELPADEADTIWAALASRLEPHGYVRTPT